MKPSSEDTIIDTEEAQLHALFKVPPDAKGLVVFAHGSGSGRHSPRNRFVARYLNHKSYATLLADLLTEEEAADRRNIFDMDLLSGRLVQLVNWASRQPETEDLQIALFGASTGGGAALAAASHLSDQIKAVVSRGGRPDLAAERLPFVNAPTLLIVGGKDQEVLHLNQKAAQKLECAFEIAVVPGATHLFEEDGALEKVAELATDWFDSYLFAKTADADRTAHLSAPL